MKKFIFILMIFLFSKAIQAQTTCDTSGNFVIYSNYDGGVLDINVDVNIPNLKIGVVSYEMVTVNLSGPYVNNVTAVQFAGYTTTNHHHCSNSPLVTSITGAPLGTDTIIYMPNSPVINPNGYYLVICNIACDTITNQGGCNTPDQLAAYFQQQFGGTLRYQYTQYGCWTGTYNISSGGNCCVGAASVLPSPQSNFISSDTLFCDKKCLDFTDLSTNNPTSWQWLFPGADSTSSAMQNPSGICYSSFGSFDVSLIACNSFGCDTLFMPAFIHEFQPPATPVVTGHADTLFSSAGYQYQWYNATGPISGASNSTYIFQQSGAYYVIVSDSNGCSASSQVINTGINNIKNIFQMIRISPNPSTGKFEILGLPVNRGNFIIDITDLEGKHVYRSVINAEQNVINTYDMASGIYFIRISGDAETMMMKLLVQNRID